MTERTYAVAPAKIGNAAGLRLPASFYRDHPQFANAGGWVEVLTENTVSSYTELITQNLPSNHYLVSIESINNFDRLLID